jgi:hypothetical protein
MLKNIEKKMKFETKSKLKLFNRPAKVTVELDKRGFTMSKVSIEDTMLSSLRLKDEKDISRF